MWEGLHRKSLPGPPARCKRQNLARAELNINAHSDVLSVFPLGFRNPGQGKGERNQILNRRLKPLISLSVL